MAVYKATLCYPFLNAIDIRTAQYKDYSSQPMQLLTCKIDSSNTNITGYKIRILSGDNQQVFPVDTTTEGKISPISELQLTSLGYDPNKLNINSGLNGTTLRIPFFQSEKDAILTSHNAVYYKPKFLADHIIASFSETGLLTPMDDISNWTYDNGRLTYNWVYNKDGDPATEADIRENDIVLDGNSILTGETVLVLDSSNAYHVGLYEVTAELNEQTQVMTTVLVQQISVLNQGITIIKGDTLHNCSYTVAVNGLSYTKNINGGTWVDIDGNEIILLDSNNSSYKWEITLYQGNFEINEDDSISYSDVDPEWLDITLASGKIMGSTPNRIQIASDDDDNNGQNTIYLPEGIDGAPVVLQGKYIELGDTKPTDIMSGGVRTYVKTYDAVYGHAYPREDVLSTTNINDANYCQFFKYSSNPSEILNTDIVNFCFNIYVPLKGYTIESTNTSSEEQRLLTKTWKGWNIDSSDSTVSVTNRYIAIDSSTPSVFNFENYKDLIKDGDLILLANQSSDSEHHNLESGYDYENGVYQINKITANPPSGSVGDDGIRWCLKRVNGYNQWSNYLGKVIYCQNGTGNTRNINMQSLASAGGTLWDINSTSCGTSLLYFSQERPILLFPQKIIKNFNLYDYNNTSSSTRVSASVDGKVVKVGDVILYRDKKYATVTTVSNTTYTTTTPIDISTDGYGYYYILDGKVYKELIVAIDNINEIAVSWDLHTAKILHNITTKTFISPWKTLEDNMKIALLNNKFIDSRQGFEVGQRLICDRTKIYFDTTLPHSDINQWLYNLPYIDNGVFGVYPLVISQRDGYYSEGYFMVAAKVPLQNNEYAYMVALFFEDISSRGVVRVIYADRAGSFTLDTTYQWDEGFNNLDPSDHSILYYDGDVADSTIIRIENNGWWNGGLAYMGMTAGSRWLKINSHNDTVFYITHDAIGQPLVSYDKDNSSIPWSYEIRSFFKASDENPFYSYELPYITLMKNNETYSDLHITSEGRRNFYSKATAIEEYLVYNNQGGVQDLLVAADYKAQATVTGKSVKLQGIYESFGQSSWESYQWILYDENYNTVQDTGKRYDKNMSVVFLGLSNDTDEDITYTALLLVENNFGDVIMYVVELKIAPGEEATFIEDNGIFSVIFDCSTHSNIINYKENASIEGDNNLLYSIYKREYEVLVNPKPVKKCYSNVTEYQVIPAGGIILYKDEERTMIITGDPTYIYVDQNTYTYQYNNLISGFEFTEDFKIYKGKWEPVTISDNRQWLRDFNITNDRSYEYIIYPTKMIESDGEAVEAYTTEQAFANYTGKIWTTQDGLNYVCEQGKLKHGNHETSISAGEPVHTHWECWSITELIPEESDLDAPVVRKQYKVDNNNIWLFKYSLETGSQTQNISKDEFATLGRFSKFGFGNKNYESGSVNALIGSELVLSSQFKYVERLGKNRIIPTTSNERAKMLDQWNDFCYSKNPKLLKDMKGRSWIVQVTSNTTTPQNFIHNVPEVVNFEWKQVDTTDNIIINGDYTTEDQQIKATIGAAQWKSPYKSIK